jgi:hypothetical protein
VRRPAAERPQPHENPARPPEPAPAEHALLTLQRSAGNAAVARALIARQPAPPPVKDPEAEALAKVDKLPAGVLSGNGTKPLATEEQKKHFLRAGKELWGDYDKALAWFGAIRNVKIPGGAMLHDSAAKRIEAVATALGSDMPAGYGGFQFRQEFDASSKFTALSHHTLGLAIDYDPRDMVRIGSHVGPKSVYSPSADLITLVTGDETHEDLGEYSQRRATIRKLGQATAAGKEVKTVAGGQALLDKIESETERLGKASADFQASLGPTRDAFLQLRKDYLAAKPRSKERRDVMAKVPDAITPWLDAVEKAAKKLRDEATAAGLDPDKLDAAAMKQRVAQLDAILNAALKLRAVYSDDPTKLIEAKHEAQVAGWEAKVGMKPDPTAEGYERLDTVVTMASGESGQLEALLGHGPRLKQLAELKTRLTTDAGFLFGSSAGKTEDTPPLAQLVESGFFSPGTPDVKSSDRDERGNFDAKFIQAMVTHGFDTGTAWSGAFTDSMHFELVTGLF